MSKGRVMNRRRLGFDVMCDRTHTSTFRKVRTASIFRTAPIILTDPNNYPAVTETVR